MGSSEVDRNQRESYIFRSYRRANVPAAVKDLITSGAGWRLFGPVLAAALLSLVLAVAGVDGDANSEYFAIVAGVIPVLALAIFIVVERHAYMYGGDEALRMHYMWLGRSLGLQLLAGEVASLYAVASQATSRALALIVGAVVVAEIRFLVRFTFWFEEGRMPY